MNKALPSVDLCSAVEAVQLNSVQLKLHVANGHAVWIAATPHDVEDCEDTPEVESLVLEAKVNELLNLPFERALHMCPALQNHIEIQEDAMDVKEEFRQAWGPDGPSDLRDALRAILDPNVAAQNKAEAEAIMQEHQSLLGENTPKGGSIDLGQVLDEPALTQRGINARVQQSPELQRVVGTISKMQDHLLGPEMNTFEWGGKPPREQDAMVDLSSLLNLNMTEGANGPQPKLLVDDLLRTPFDEALEMCPMLQKYITEHPDADMIEQEFREHWGPDCQALRVTLEVVLGQVPNSEIDDFNKDVFFDDKETSILQMESDKNAFLRGERSPMSSLDGLQMMLSSLDCLENLVGKNDTVENQEDLRVHKSDMKTGALSGSDIEDLRAMLDLQDLYDSGEKEMRTEDKLGIARNFSVDDLLALPFETALKSYPALEDYIGDNVDLKEEFRSNWSSDAPADLRSTLSQLFRQDLLSLNFEEALDACTALRQYIEVQEVKRASVKDEFANHWGAHAPFELCSVLEELVGKRDNSRSDHADMRNKVSYPPRSRL